MKLCLVLLIAVLFLIVMFLVSLSLGGPAPFGGGVL